MKKHRVLGSPEKDVAASDSFTAIGTKIESSSAARSRGVCLVSSPPEKVASLVALTARVFRLPVISRTLASRVAGSWTSVFASSEMPKLRFLIRSMDLGFGMIRMVMKSYLSVELLHRSSSCVVLWLLLLRQMFPSPLLQSCLLPMPHFKKVLSFRRSSLSTLQQSFGWVETSVELTQSSTIPLLVL